MNSYLSMISHVLKNGKPKKERGHSTIGVFALDFEFDLSTGKFPLLTTKEVSYKSIAAELYCFIHAITSKRSFRLAGTKIWSNWANPTKLRHIHDKEKREEKMVEEDDLGPIYGFQWRMFAHHYQYQPDLIIGHNMYEGHYAGDQLLKIADGLRTNPNSRRMVCSAWCPTQEHMQALPPCHVLWNLVHYDGVLNLCWHQRSADLAIGVPYNIASYALLLLLLAKHAGLKPGTISGKFADAHIYVRNKEDSPAAICHRAGLEEQLRRVPNELPQLEIQSKSPVFDIFQWKPTDLELTGYTYHPAIKFEVAV